LARFRADTKSIQNIWVWHKVNVTVEKNSTEGRDGKGRRGRGEMNPFQRKREMHVEKKKLSESKARSQIDRELRKKTEGGGGRIKSTSSGKSYISYRRPLIKKTLNKNHKRQGDQDHTCEYGQKNQARPSKACENVGKEKKELY